MKSKSADKIKMPSIDELLGVSGEESATDIDISRIHSFANHPCMINEADGWRGRNVWYLGRAVRYALKEVTIV